MLKPAAFLDRDGVINKDKGYLYKIQEFEWVEGSKQAIKFLNDKNFHVSVVSNQSGIARGYYSEKDVKKLHEYINVELKKIGAQIDDFFISPYHPDIKKKFRNLSHLRKPNTGMLELAFKNWQVDKKNSFLIGDKYSDIECAKNFGIPGYLFSNENLLNFIMQKINL